MVPRINKLDSLDVYRDGGSLSVTYRDDSDNQHELMFSIANRESDANKSRNTYRDASLISYIKSEYVSPVTGVASPDFEKQELAISWPEAVELLGALEPHLNGFNSEYLWVFSSMVTVASDREHSIEYS